MKSNWIKIHSSDKVHEVELIKAFLLDHGIQPFSINKTDSINTFLRNGEIEIFVKGEDVMMAKKLLSNKLF